MRFIGNKTQLLNNIKDVVDRHAKEAASFCDIFSGTAAVARFFKEWYEVYSNDILYFSYCLQRGTIENPGRPSFDHLRELRGISDPIRYFNTFPLEEMECLESSRRLFQNSYAPAGGRMYVTDANALRIDYARNKIENWHNERLLTDDEYYYLVASVIEGIPYVSNIAGTYGAYNKTWDPRSHKQFLLQELPVVSNGRSNRSYNMDGAQLLQKISGDILYIDPPYNARQYLPNYHVLETAAKYDFPKLKGVTGQRADATQRSEFCSKKTVVHAFDELMRHARFRHIILSYNTDGLMTLDEIEMTMKKYGREESFEVNYIPYRRFKSRRDIVQEDELKEMLIYIQKDI